MSGEPDLTRCSGFEWDEGNLLKNWETHRVSASECEQVFFNQPLVTGDDERHSGQEPRYYGLGQTDASRRLFVVFTVRGTLIRVISARDIESSREARVRIEMKKKIPNFKSESEERKFWSTADSTRYIDWQRAQRVALPNLRPSLKTISLRLPELMLEELKLLANKRDVPYQSLLKLFLAERIEEELRQRNGRERKSNSALGRTGRRSARR